MEELENNVAVEADVFDRYFDADPMEAEDTTPAETDGAEIDEDADAPDTTDGDEANDDSEESPIEEQTEQIEPETESETPPVLPPIQSKYNGREIAVDAQAAQLVAQAYGLEANALVTTIQKGLNYDKLDSQLQILRDYAAFSGISVPDVSKQLSDGLETMAYNMAMEELKKKFPGSDPVLLDMNAREQARQKLQAVVSRREQPLEKPEEQGNSDPYAKAKQEWREFAQWKPEIKSLNDVPREVRDAAFQTGVHPIRAYLEYENKRLAVENARLAEEAKAAGTNRRNRARSTGSMSGSSGNEVDLFDKFFD